MLLLFLDKSAWKQGQGLILFQHPGNEAKVKKTFILNKQGLLILSWPSFSLFPPLCIFFVCTNSVGMCCPGF